ncbi:unnamed protein product, partial [Mesorhabditis belari]|uniref:Nicotinic acetylcholine receptor alpha subunit n=1 Tax=Mesorhabditis belari TaxID=2138241 RepID=A0AAF3F655_9BILA
MHGGALSSVSNRFPLKRASSSLCVLLFLQFWAVISANQHANRLFEDLLADYNKLVRPVENNTASVTVRFKLKLSQLLDVHEKNQIMTTNVWLQHSWEDYKLRWDPIDYGGVQVLYVPPDMIWLPDIVLYNNADGNYQVQIMTKAKLNYNGTVEWAPPAIYKSMCPINVEFFPFDDQTCEMKFGSWTYGGLEVDLQHRDANVTDVPVNATNGEIEIEKVVYDGIDLTDYYPSVEWDIMGVPGTRHEKRYPCCESPFIDITYEIKLKRKTLFYTVNLMIPSVGISFLTALVFYLPSNGGEKISLCISILISLTVFFLLLVEIIPSTSLVIPLIGRYLLFTMVLVTLSVVVTVVTLNVFYRSPATHTMPKWVKVVFIEFLPKYLFMQRPQPIPRQMKRSNGMAPPTAPNPAISNFSIGGQNHYTSAMSDQMDYLTPGVRRRASSNEGTSFSLPRQREVSPVRSAVESVAYIADSLKNDQDDKQVIEDWKYVSVVLDRVFLILFALACTIGTYLIIFRRAADLGNKRI